MGCSESLIKNTDESLQGREPNPSVVHQFKPSVVNQAESFAVHHRETPPGGQHEPLEERQDTPPPSDNVLPANTRESPIRDPPRTGSPTRREEQEERVPPYVPHRLQTSLSSSSAASSDSSSSSLPKLSGFRPPSPSVDSTVSQKAAGHSKKRKRSFGSSHRHRHDNGEVKSALLQEYLDETVRESLHSSSSSLPQLFHAPEAVGKKPQDRVSGLPYRSAVDIAVAKLAMEYATMKTQSLQKRPDEEEEQQQLGEKHGGDVWWMAGTKPKTEKKKDEEGGALTWTWWEEKVKHQLVTRDSLSRERLLAIQINLQRQYTQDSENVELDLSQCYLERTAPLVLGKFLTSPDIVALRWVTSLRLSGNYFSNEGFWVLLSSLRKGSFPSSSGDRPRTMLHLKELYLHHTTMDYQRVAALLAILFPIHRAATMGTEVEGLRIGNNVATLPAVMQEEGFTHYLDKCSSVQEQQGGSVETLDPAFTKPLFPCLTTLVLSDNEALGVTGLVHILRSLIATHYYSHDLAVLDVSRCGIGTNGARYVEEFFNGVRKAQEQMCYPVVPRRFLLYGNPIAEYLHEYQQQSQGRKKSRSIGGSGEGIPLSLSLSYPDIHMEV